MRNTPLGSLPPRRAVSVSASSSITNTTSSQDAIAAVMPTSPEAWEDVRARYQEYAASANRAERGLASLRKKWSTLINSSKPTGDPTCPPDIRRAKQLYRELQAMVEIVGLDDHALLAESEGTGTQDMSTQDTATQDTGNNDDDDEEDDHWQSDQDRENMTQISNIRKFSRSITPRSSTSSPAPSRLSQSTSTSRRQRTRNMEQSIISFFDPEVRAQRDILHLLERQLAAKEAHIRELERENRQLVKENAKLEGKIAILELQQRYRGAGIKRRREEEIEIFED
ncbi:hypothetical protein BDZ91DRAFT_781090 [Kalaharituber pfeilii]|nr:hypothetical protein BDZ91DRAFT_781090 [Kalaharituber pfeilii]